MTTENMKPTQRSSIRISQRTNFQRLPMSKRPGTICARLCVLSKGKSKAEARLIHSKALVVVYKSPFSNARVVPLPMVPTHQHPLRLAPQPGLSKSIQKPSRQVSSSILTETSFTKPSSQMRTVFLMIMDMNQGSKIVSDHLSSPNVDKASRKFYHPPITQEIRMTPPAVVLGGLPSCYKAFSKATPSSKRTKEILVIGDLYQLHRVSRMLISELRPRNRRRGIAQVTVEQPDPSQRAHRPKSLSLAFTKSVHPPLEEDGYDHEAQPHQRKAKTT